MVNRDPYMDVSKNRGTPKFIWMFPKIGGKPPKWMVKIMENPMNKWDDLRGKKPYSCKHPIKEL